MHRIKPALAIPVLFLTALMAMPLQAQDLATPVEQPAATTQPTYHMMDKERMKFVLPPDWRRVGASDDDLTHKYVSEDNDGIVIFIISPQSSPPGPSIRGRMAQVIVKGLNEAIDKQDIQITMRPTQEKDDRFFLRFRTKFMFEAQEADQLHLYAVVGANLVMANVTGTGSKERNKEILEQGEAMLLSFSPHKPGNPLPADVPDTPPAPKNPPSRPSGFSKARIRLVTPAGWKEEKTDQPRGIVATYEDSAGSNLITVSVRPIAKNIAADPALRKIFIDEVVASEQGSVTIKDAKPVGKPEEIPDDKVLRKTRTLLESPTAKTVVTMRVVMVGDVIATVTALGPESDAAEVDKVAGDLAAELKPMGTLSKGS